MKDRPRDKTAEGFIDIRVAPATGHDEARQRPHISARRAEAARLFGTGDRALLEKHIEVARLQRARLRDAGAIDGTEGFPRGPAQFISDRGRTVLVELTKDPGGPPIFGGTDVHVSVSAEQNVPGVLRLRLDAERAAPLIPETIHLGRWDAHAKRFRLLAASEYRADDGYVFGRIGRSGIYTAAGLPRDERVLATLGIFSTLREWLDGPDGLDLLPKICGLILCVPDAPGGPGSVCDMCLGGGGLTLDLDIFDLGHFRPPVGFVPPASACTAWESVGPAGIPGRISALVAHPTDSKILCAGAAAGGVFKSTDTGATWSALWDGELSLAIGGLAISRSDPRVLYAATGEWVGTGFTTPNHFQGVGVYRTSDGGVHWDLLAAIPSVEASAVAIDPTDPLRVYVAGDRALHRSVDGGRTWDTNSPYAQRGMYDGVVTDVKIDPNDPGRIYIGVDLDGVYVNTSHGSGAWTALTGIPTGQAAVSPKIALGSSGAHGSRFVAVLMGRQVYTSIDGVTFARKTDVDAVPWALFQATWDTVIAVDPTNEDVLLAGHVSLNRSVDGGQTWTAVGGFAGSNEHVDQQAIAFDPGNHDHVFVATDGGVSESTDNGRTWRLASFGLVTTQCWTVAVSQVGAPERIAVTTQDNQCYQALASFGPFTPILPWEGGIIEYDPQNADIIYADTWFEPLKRSDNAGQTWTNIEPQPIDTMELAIARGDPKLLLAVKNTYGVPATRLARSPDRGATWTTVLAAGNYPLTTATFAPSDDGHGYAGMADGKIAHSEDRGVTWWILPVLPLPIAPVRRIAVDPTDPLRIYVAFGALGVRQLWRGDLTAVNAVRWTDVTGRVPATRLPDLAVTGIVLDPRLDETIYVSNLLGVYRTLDGGDSWAPFDDGLPNCFVSDLRARAGATLLTLFASTMGRGVYRRLT